MHLGNQLSAIDEAEEKAEYANKHIKAQREREKDYVPLRISPTIVLLVPPHKATLEYAEWWRENKLKL